MSCHSKVLLRYCNLSRPFLLLPPDNVCPQRGACSAPTRGAASLPCFLEIQVELRIDCGCEGFTGTYKQPATLARRRL